jgi:hypothetical protein
MHEADGVAVEHRPPEAVFAVLGNDTRRPASRTTA